MMAQSQKLRLGKAKNQTERLLHKQVGDLLSWLDPDCVWFPVPNGATDLGITMGSILKAQWKVKEGVADWCFQWRDGAGQIELKRPGGTLTEGQRRMQRICGERGVRYTVCHSLDEVTSTLLEWGRISAEKADRFLQRKA